MAMNIGSPESEEDAPLAAINTTPLVDVMLVLLIIFLITIPVVTHTIPVRLPETSSQMDQIKPKTVVIAVTRDGNVYWDQQKLPDSDALFVKLQEVRTQHPQPEIDVRGDQDVRYEVIGRVVWQCQRAGIAHIAFISQPPPRGS